MSIQRLSKFLFGAGDLWEFRVVAARIVVIAAAIFGMYLLLNSDFKQYAVVAFWIFIVVVIASIVYQYRRRWKEIQREREKR